jgi:REP element-mobilizing transposase RayT
MRRGEEPQDHRRRVEAALDSGLGECLLARGELAAIVCERLFHGSGRIHDLHAFVVMPNHVHVLTVFKPGFPMAEVVRGWKGLSARQINAALGREGPFWQRDYFDRYIRDARHFERASAYIENNPVSAGLVKRAADWPYSSAGAAVPRPPS